MTKKKIRIRKKKSVSPIYPIRVDNTTIFTKMDINNKKSAIILDLEPKTKWIKDVFDVRGWLKDTNTKYSYTLLGCPIDKDSPQSSCAVACTKLVLRKIIPLKLVLKWSHKKGNWSNFAKWMYRP